MVSTLKHRLGEGTALKVVIELSIANVDVRMDVRRVE